MALDPAPLLAAAAAVVGDGDRPGRAGVGSMSGKALARDGHPHQCMAAAVAPSAPRQNPKGRCRNVIGLLLWASGERCCWRHGGRSLRRIMAGAIADRVVL